MKLTEVFKIKEETPKKTVSLQLYDDIRIEIIKMIEHFLKDLDYLKHFDNWQGPKASHAEWDKVLNSLT